MSPFKRLGSGTTAVVAWSLCSVVLSGNVETRAETVTVTFESAPVRSVSLGSGFWATNGGFSDQGVELSGQSWGGFVASQSQELSGWGYFFVAGSPHAAEISAYANPPAGGGAGGSRTFAVASGNSSTVNLPAGSFVQSVKATNTATAFYSLRDGDQFARPFGKVFDEDSEDGAWVDAGVADWFKVTFTGFSGVGRTGDVTGQVEFFLADFRFDNSANDYIIQDWTSIDLAPLGSARSIGLGFTSSDTGLYGMNTPAYVALDDLTFVAVPEPSTLAIAAGGLVWLAGAYRRLRSGA